MIFVGVDPGITGAVAFVAPTWAEVHDLPVVASGKGTVRREVNAAALAGLLDHFCPGADVTIALERTGAMPKQGVASMFSMGVSRGIVLGVVGALRLPLIEVAPMVWKRHFGLLGADKDASRRIAIQRLPSVAPRLGRVKDHNRAEAVLLALYARDSFQRQGGLTRVRGPWYTS